MIHILEAFQMDNDVTSFYRGRLPLAELMKFYPNEISIMNSSGPRNIAWPELCLADIVYMIRPYTHDEVEVAHMAKQNGIKVWCDWDDNLFNVPAYNESYLHYKDPQVIKNMEELIKYADLITVTTRHLKKEIQKHTKDDKIHVVPNALHMRSFKDIRKPGSNIAYYRGHRKKSDDVYEYSDVINSLIKEYPDWQFIFVGEYWPFFKGKNVVNIPTSYIMKFYGYLRQLNPGICLVPFADNEFNKSKSNINWIEATCCGATCVAPQWDQWMIPGCVNYIDQEGFYEAVETLINDEFCRSQSHKDSAEYLLENYTLPKANEQRLKLIQELVLS